ncbi:MAG: hypothetical protein GTO08_12090, partial [Deltaproteobacteria bacterium]|nr:hypothetical protein [Deltaproteobacteria bacterium]
MKRNRRRLSLFFLSLWVLFSPFVLRSDTFASEEKEALIKWEGKVVLSENFVVREVEKLVVEPGTEIVVSPDKNIIIRILGSIEVRGEKDRPVKFRPEGEIAPGKWNGIRIANPRENILKNCTIEGAASGISLTESSLSIEASTIQLCNSAVKVFQRSVARVKDCLFSNNIMGIQVSLSGKIEIMGSRFESNREIGIVIENGATGSVKRSEFSNGKIGLFGFTKSPVVTEESNFHSLEQGVVFRQVGRNSALRYCTFEKNTTGLQSVQFSFERISDSHFKNNRTAIDVREFSSPHITHCEFHNNEVGINLFRKSNSLVDFNVFRNNRTAMILNFSCYPVIHDNNLERNEIHVKLGKF